MKLTYKQVVSQLASAQKGAARSAPAYSRFVNRRLGRLLAAAAFKLGLTPNQVTVISAVFTFSGIALLALLDASWSTGILVSALLVTGYALDSADGQLARLTKVSSSAGEWLDHMFDAVKAVALPLALLVGLYNADVLPAVWLLVPLVAAIVNSVLFFGMILTEKLRAALGVTSRARTEGRVPWLRSILVIPTDYGLLCLSFLFYGSLWVFFPLYTAITAATAVFLLLAAVKWFRELGSLNTRSASQLR